MSAFDPKRTSELLAQLRPVILLAPLFASLPLVFGLSAAEAGMINPSETAVTLPADAKAFHGVMQRFSRSRAREKSLKNFGHADGAAGLVGGH
jgi:hypothetical protein